MISRPRLNMGHIESNTRSNWRKILLTLWRLLFNLKIFNFVRMFVLMICFSLVLLVFYAICKSISVISWQQFTYSWSLSKQTSTTCRLKNVPWSRALHHDHSTVTDDQTRCTQQFQIPEANHSAMVYSSWWYVGQVWIWVILTLKLGHKILLTL